jgi:hypothetical protein
MSITAKLVETDDDTTVVDEYGDVYAVIATDAQGNFAIERDASEKWEAGTFIQGHEGAQGEIYLGTQGDMFDDEVSRDTYVLVRTDSAGSLRWRENKAAEVED